MSESLKPSNIKLKEPEMFTSEDLSVICWKGENYYRACNEFVSMLDDGGKSHCVKREHHAGVHEDYEGRITKNDIDFTDMPLREAVFCALGMASMCWETPAGAGVFDSSQAEAIGNKLMIRIKQAGPIYD